ncbi:DHA2 family efflux MFS transporter permease subunit [Pseudalkalibacillus caeni]|uniref:DHA2 family efflux MFS transporter permease subunit n=1 Tax=Exobacillus caeni TaxID=2574798 RepID=A0A5R9EYQ8_9BACL|nr:DHA2 family efflux MFS transporter permease subunit [Pseudalkalibacillus caeni]TLS35336.1 DHA2 family efflux MFS transporter permease subunit [Pseudalkalibacillus caeni]
MEGENAQNNQEFKIFPIVAVLISGTFAAILNQTLLATALPHIMRDLDLSANTAQWLTTVFMLVNGVMIPVTAFLIETFTTRRLFLSAMGLFGLGTLICAVAPNFPVLIIGRIVQASGAGIMIPLMQTVFFVIFPVEKRGSAMGLFGLVIAFAPAIGPTLSGWLVDHFPWRSLFYVVLPIAMIDFIVAYFVLKNVTKRSFPKLDILSIILSTIGFGGLLYGCSIAGTHGWGSTEVLVTLLIGAVALAVFILRQFRLEQPILEFKVFKYGVFTLATGLGMIVFIAMIGGATILPIYMQNMHHFTAFESGLMLLPGALLMGIMSPISGKIFDKFGARWLAVIGLIIVTGSTFMFTNLTAETTFFYMATVNAVRMFGVALVMMPVTTAGLNQLPRRLIAHGTAMNNTMRQVSGSVGTAILVTVMTNNALNPQKYGVEGLIHGVNVSFIVAGITSGLGLILAFFLKKASPAEE